MAKKEDIDITAGEAEEGKKSKLPLIIAAVVVVVLAGVGAMMMSGGDEETAETEAETVAEAAPVKQTPIYFALPKGLTVNFSKQSNNAVRYLQLKLKVMARDQQSIDDFELHLPTIQHELLLLLYSQRYKDLNTSAGTQALRKTILSLINEVLAAQQTTSKIEAAYLTSLIMQ